MNTKVISYQPVIEKYVSDCFKKVITDKTEIHNIIDNTRTYNNDYPAMVNIFKSTISAHLKRRILWESWDVYNYFCNISMDGTGCTCYKYIETKIHDRIISGLDLAISVECIDSQLIDVAEDLKNEYCESIYNKYYKKHIQRIIEKEIWAKVSQYTDEVIREMIKDKD